MTEVLQGLEQLFRCQVQQSGTAVKYSSRVQLSSTAVGYSCQVQLTGTAAVNEAGIPSE